MSKTRILTIIGNVGAGKSTALKMVAEQLDGLMVEADDLFQTVDPFRDRYLEDIDRWAFANELWLTLERSKLLGEEYKKCTKPWMVVDSGLLMSWVYTHSHWLAGRLDNHEWQLYEQIYDRLVEGLEPDAALYLRYSIPTLLERIGKRGREYELEYYSREYLEQLERGLEAVIERLEGLGVVVQQTDEKMVGDFESEKRSRDALVRIVKQWGK